MSSGLIGGLAAAIVVPLVMMAVAKLSPYQPAGKFANEVPLEELRKRYQVWEVCSILPIAGFTVLFTLLWFGLFKLLQTFVQSQLPASEFLLVPPNAFWFLPAFFLGMISAAIPTHLLYSHLLGERYQEYTHYTNLRVGFDGWRIFRWIAAVFVAIAFVVAVAALDSYTRFTDTSLVDNAFLSLGERTYPYSDIQEIRAIATFKAPNGNIVQRPYHQIVHKDGSKWSTRDGLHHDDDAKAETAIMAFVSKQSGKPIKKYDIVPD